jgi:hypothetical protein
LNDGLPTLRPQATPACSREELAEIYTHDFVPLSTRRHAHWIIGEIARSVGISREEVIATAKADPSTYCSRPSRHRAQEDRQRPESAVGAHAEHQVYPGVP